MLSKQDNDRLTKVGAGTPVGDLLRRYWYPIAAAPELTRHSTKFVKILGEELVLFKDAQGRFGLIDAYCAHRRASLVYGIPEDDGLRCPYHGWKYDRLGRCLEQPFEETVHPGKTAKDNIQLRSYSVTELGGLIFAYLGAPTGAAGAALGFVGRRELLARNRTDRYRLQLGSDRREYSGSGSRRVAARRLSQLCS
jgi:5,5'-dehydrodivanillate O-demethylase oxygenase subunit